MPLSSNRKWYKSSQESSLPLGMTPACFRLLRAAKLLSGGLAAGVQAVEVQDRVQHHRVGSPRFTAIDGIDGEQHDVAFAGRRVHNGRVLGDFVATFHQARNQQVLTVGVAENHAGAYGRRNYAEAVALRSEEHTSELQS